MAQQWWKCVICIIYIYIYIYVYALLVQAVARVRFSAQGLAGLMPTYICKYPSSLNASVFVPTGQTDEHLLCCFVCGNIPQVSQPSEPFEG